MLLRSLAGVLTVFVAVTAGVAAAGYLQIPIPRPPEPPIGGFDDGDVVPPEPDGPRTLLVLGSDRRAATAVDGRAGVPHSDTIVLLRLDPDRNRIAVLSLPRDLAVKIPGYAGLRKINEAYDHGGPPKTLATVKALFGDKLEINGVIDVDFNGFQRAVNAVGGVYADVDRDYTNPEGTGFATIDVKAGYQRLVGSDALAYVRYRHTDSDLFRNARQQEFLRQASRQPAVDRLKNLGAAGEFLDDLVAYFRFDKSFQSRRNSAGMIKTALSLALHHAPVNQIALGGITESENPRLDTRLFVTDDRVREAYDAFLTGKRNPKPSSTAPRRTKAVRATGLEHAGSLGEDLAVVASSRLGSLPFYFPELRFTGSTYVTGTPRVYSDRDEQGRRFRAYRLVVATGATGEYYGVQGMTWKDPPLLASPDRVRLVSGRRLELFYDGPRLRVVAWRTRSAVYYVSNTLNRRLSNTQMLAIAGSLRRLRS
jgi:polyisoprenyl-teichoic acid--peptidoglycan teichoic acid transferase